jgi:hypothetical protein
MDERENSSVGTWIALATLVLAVSGALIGGGYKLGYDTGEKDYEASKDFAKTLPPMMEELKNLAGDLAKSTEIADENKRLKSQVDADAIELKQLHQKTQDQSAENKKQGETITAFKDQINAIFPASVITKEIAIDSAEEVIPNVLTIGVDNIMTISKTVQARLNNDRNGLEVGQSVNVTVAEHMCIVRLVNMKEKAATFTVTCLKSS